MAEPRTDVGTFVFRLPSTADGAKVTVEYAHSSESVVFHLYHHGPERQGAVQLSGTLLEIEANQVVVGKVWQDDGDRWGKRWERDRRCMKCGQDRERFLPVCSGCAAEAVEAAVARANGETVE